MERPATLREEIDARQRQQDARRQEFEAKQAELDALETTARLCPWLLDAISSPDRSNGRQQPVVDQAGTASGNGVRGRQRGDVSPPWRAILERMKLSYPTGASPDQIAAMGQECGLPGLRPNKARKRMEAYLPLGYVVPSGQDLFQVTQTAAERFGLPS